MATSTGKYQGIQYRPLEGVNVSDWITNRENQMIKFRQEQRLEDEARAKAKEARDKKFEEAHERAKELKLDSTGSDTLDGTFADVLMIAREEQHRLIDITKDPNVSEQEKSRAYTKLSNLEALPDRLLMMANNLMTEKTNYDKLLSEDGVWKDEAYEKRFQNGYKGVTISLDDNMNPVSIFRSTDQDVDNDGIIDVETFDSLGDIHSRPQFIKKYDRDTLITKDAGLINAATEDDIRNGIKTTELKDSVEKAVNKAVQTRLYGNSNAGPSPIMLSLLKEYGYDLKNPTDTQLDQIESDYKDALMAKLDPGIKKVEAVAGINANLRAAELQRRQEKDNEPKETKQSAADAMKNNAIRTTVDGILAGDPKYLATLKNTKLQEQGSDGKDIIIDDVEYSDGKIKIYLSGKMNGKDVITVDAKNERQAIGEVLKLIDPAGKSAELLERYRLGEVTDGDITTSTATGRFRKPITTMVNKLSGNRGKSLDILKENGFEGFTKEGFFGSKVKAPWGDIYDLDNADDKKQLIEDLVNKKDQGGKPKTTADKLADLPD